MKTFLLLLTLSFSATAFSNEARSPFTDVLYDSLPSVTVEHNGQTYFLLSVAGIRRAQIMQACEDAYKNRCQYMFAENFIETMKTAGVDVGATTSLSLYKMENYQILNLDNQAVTAENQEQVVINRALRGEE